MRHLRYLGFLSALVLLAAFANSTIAQSAQSAPNPAPVSDRELRAFVKTYVETQNIRQEYEPPIEKSSDPARKQRLHQNANAELKEALARNNLTVDQYNRIFARVNSDKPLRDKVLKMVEEERKKSPKAPAPTR